MKNFEMQCPVDGTAALQPEFGRTPLSSGTIVAFPAYCPRDVHAVDSCEVGGRETSVPLAFAHSGMLVSARNSEMVRSLRLGSVRGLAYGCVKPWQAALAGCTFSVLAFASMLIG